MTVCRLVFVQTSSLAGPMINQGRNQHNNYQVDQGSAKSSFIHYWPFVQRGGTGIAAKVQTEKTAPVSDRAKGKPR